ncbi:MAG: GntR family transcriptional regulator [Candidatus Micrarchaeaceae archaeon]
MEHHTREEQVPQGLILAEEIRNRIIAGYYKSGERLVELDIANEFNVSRTVVRESLKILEKDGFLESEIYKGVRVKKFTFEEIREYYEIRIALECLCISLVVDKKDKNLKNYLQKNIALSKKALEETDFSTLVPLGNEFHKILHISSGNKKLEGMLNNLRTISSIMRPPIWAIVPDRARSTIEEHEKITEAVIIDKKTLAIKRMRCHIINSYKSVEKYLQELYFAENREKLSGILKKM